MGSYYYTFGCSPGFPHRHENTLSCSFFYDEEQWARMDPEHRWTGWKLHEVIE